MPPVFGRAILDLPLSVVAISSLAVAECVARFELRSSDDGSIVLDDLRYVFVSDDKYIRRAEPCCNTKLTGIGLAQVDTDL